MDEMISTLFFDNKKGEESSITKHLVYWILMGICIIIIWLIVKGIINKLLTLY